MTKRIKTPEQIATAKAEKSIYDKAHRANMSTEQLSAAKLNLAERPTEEKSRARKLKTEAERARRARQSPEEAKKAREKAKLKTRELKARRKAEQPPKEPRKPVKTAAEYYRERKEERANRSPEERAKENEKLRQKAEEKRNKRTPEEREAAKIKETERKKLAKTKWTRSQREKVNENARRYSAKIPAEKKKEQSRKWLAANKGCPKLIARRKVNSANYGRKHRGIINSRGSLRRATKLKATPKWADKTLIAHIYELARAEKSRSGINYSIEHTIPLVSDLVCGLHCPQNLQIVTQTYNSKKGNRFWPDMP